MAQVGFGNRVRVYGSSENPSDACGAVLEVSAGKKTEMMFHLKNDKILYVLVGKINVVVIQDGMIKKKEFEKGTSAAIGPGLVHQIEALENSVIVEFGSDMAAYVEPQTDVFVIDKGTRPEVKPQDPGHNVIMTDEDRAKVEATVVETEKKSTKSSTKKTTKKRKRRRKKREDN